MHQYAEGSDAPAASAWLGHGALLDRCCSVNACMLQVTILYPSFIFNARRKYDKSRRSDPSYSSTFAGTRVDGEMPFRAGDHSFDAIPQQKPVPATSGG